MTWRWRYAVATIGMFLTELYIALFVHDGFIRPYLGDVLAVILVYLGLRTVTMFRVVVAAAIALAIAFAIELSQLIHLLDALGLARNRWARIALGGVFDMRDLLAYTIGAAAIVGIERLRGQRLS